MMIILFSLICETISEIASVHLNLTGSYSNHVRIFIPYYYPCRPSS